MVFEKTDETKVLRDPIHGYIHIDLKVIWDVVNTGWFQRLRRIRQLGGAHMVYHCAEHNRFSHSLGVYEIVRRMCSEVPDIAGALSEREKVTVMLAGLLHDVGHGPYSHAFEAISRTSHETVTCRIIEEDTEITKILNECAKGLAKDVADVIRHKSRNRLLCQMISSQLDADRMDYLIRDAYFTGTTYGTFDLERILRTLRVEKDRLVVKESGVYAVENYIMARYHMYWQVYYHPVARSYEGMIHTLFHRLKEIGTDDPSVIPLFVPVIADEEIPLEDYFRLDDNTCTYGFMCLDRHPDPILRDLSRRIRDRDLFKYTDNIPNNRRKIRERLDALEYPRECYLIKDAVRQRPYVPYTGNKDGAIWVGMKDGSLRELSAASNIVYSLIHGPQNDDNKIFYPREAECESM